MNILCICGDWSEDYELAVPYHFFRALGHTVHTTTTGKADGDYITPAFMILTQNIKP